VNALADSGVETLLRIAAVAQGWRVEVQVVISGMGRVDLLIDGWLVVEVDGYRWHSSAAQVAEDHRRDALCVLQGRRYHRFGYDQVMDDVDGCLAVIRELLASGRPSDLFLMQNADPACSR
jgi:very-short-patch-repair endonuclease